MKTEAFPITAGAPGRRGRASRPKLGSFEHTAVGPLDIRRVLRTLQIEGGPRERLVGFAALTPAPDANRTAASLMISATPGIGQLVMLVEAVRQAGARRVYVLTDRRLLILRSDRRGRSPDRAVEADIPIESLSVRALGGGRRRTRGMAKRFAIAVAPTPGAPAIPDRRVMFDRDGRGDAQAGGARRLREAFWALSRVEQEALKSVHEPVRPRAGTADDREPASEVDRFLEEEFGPEPDSRLDNELHYEPDHERDDNATDSDRNHPGASGGTRR